MELRRLARTHGDVLTAVVIAVAYVTEISLYAPARQATAIPLALLASAGLSFRRRLPFASFLLVSVANLSALVAAPGFDANSIMLVAVFVFNLYSLGRNARGLEAWLGVAGMGLTVVGFVVGDGAHRPSDVFFALAFCGTPWAAGLAVRLRRERERELAVTNEELRRDQEERARRAVAAERARIARELHDVVSHAISVSVLQARGGRRMVGNDDEAVRRALGAIEETNTQALGDMRRLLSLLRDTEDLNGTGRDEPQPSLDRLDRLIAQVQASGLNVDLQMSGDARPVPPGVDLSAYRIIQEALTNVLKHGGPHARACVHVRYGPDDLTVSVSNTGALPAANGSGHGLIGIQERVAVAGGSVEAGPYGDGYLVSARLPYTVDA